MSSQGTPLLAWAESVLGRLGVPPELIQKLHAGSRQDDDFTIIVQFLSKHSSAHPSLGRGGALQEFFKAADSSRFTQEEWIAALALFVRHNDARTVVTTLEMMTEYMACATFSQEAKLGQLSFAPLIQYHLDTFGFENRRT